jgi:hypothetical protein
VHDTAPVYLQLGAAVFALGLGARLAARLGVSPIPLYLIAASASSTRRRSYVLVMAIAGALLMRWPTALLRAGALLARGGPPPSQRAATAGRM